MATAGDRSVALDLDQAHYASIIVGLSVRRGLPPRAASIAMATVYQETGIRNLDYGDRDSVGLFQQRPSQGWGTAKQLMDPYYATNEFYDALVKIDGWESEDINDVAQQVQRSGYPEAYRDHEADARVLASTLTGHSPAGFSCLDRSRHRGRPGRAGQLAAQDLRQSDRRHRGRCHRRGQGREPPPGLGVRALRGRQREVLRRHHGHRGRPAVADRRTSTCPIGPQPTRGHDSESGSRSPSADSPDLFSVGGRPGDHSR